MKFYTELFGWRPTESMDMGPWASTTCLPWRRVRRRMMNKPKEMAHVPPAGLLFPRARRACGRRAREKNGGQILNGPMEVPGGDWAVNCMDPQGAAFSLHHKK